MSGQNSLKWTGDEWLFTDTYLIEKIFQSWNSLLLEKLSHQRKWEQGEMQFIMHIRNSYFKMYLAFLFQTQI